MCRIQDFNSVIYLNISSSYCFVKKWHSTIGRVIDVLEEDELKTLEAAARQAQRDWFKGAVLKTLAGPAPEALLQNNYPDEYYGTSLVELLRQHKRHKNEVVAKSYLAGASLTASVPTTLT
jgi:hypothetical protein